VLIPPLGLPAPPALTSVAGSIGVVPLVIVLVAMTVLAATLAVRFVRRSR
jgi:hypothetical protein